MHRVLSDQRFDHDAYYFAETNGEGDAVPADFTRPRVGDVMYERPKALPHDALVADVRELSASSRIRLALLVDGDVCTGTVGRKDIPEDADPGGPVAVYAQSPLTIGSDQSLVEAHRLIAGTADGRLVVVNDEGTLEGLLCSNTRGTGFCTRRQPGEEGTGGSRERWRVIRTGGSEREGLLSAPSGTSFKLGDRLNLPSEDGTTSWLVVAVEPGSGDEGSLVLDPFEG